MYGLPGTPGDLEAVLQRLADSYRRGTVYVQRRRRGEGWEDIWFFPPTAIGCDPE